MKKLLKTGCSILLALMLVLAGGSAVAEDPDGLECLGYLYLEGLGVEQSQEKAIELFKLAAERGSEEAQQQLMMLGQ